jgi:arginyl-tRNA synthetase
MQSISNRLAAAFRQAIADAFNALDAEASISLSQNEKFGDYQSNAAMGLAKTLSQQTQQKLNPRQVAEQIKAKVQPLLQEIASEVSIAGPGFINVRLKPEFLTSLLQQAWESPKLGLERVPTPQRVVVDYSGPNIAKEMAVHHLRSTIIGDTLANVLESGQGHSVLRQNHLGDWGTQFGMLIAQLRTTGFQSMPEGQTSAISDLESFYRHAKKRFDDDPAFQDEARKTVVRLQAGQPEELDAWRQIVAETRRSYLPLYERLRVQLREEHERGESFYNPLLSAVVRDLKAKGLAVESEGAVAIFIDGAEKPPLIIEKTGGGYLYGTTDLAAVRFRCGKEVQDLGVEAFPDEPLAADRVIYTTDARQSQHFSQVFRTAEQAGWTHGASLEHAPFGTMLGADGKPFKTRSGETIKLKDLLDEAERRAFDLVTGKNPDLDESHRRDIARAVGIGAVKYADLSKDRISDYVFDFDKMLSLDGNTAPYLQYAYARIKSIFRKAGEPAAAAESSPAIVLAEPSELALAKHILRMGETIDLVGRELKPHHLCTYLYDLATRFSSFYENCPVLQSAPETRTSRLALCDLTARTMSLGLDLLGIEHPEQM